MHQGETALCRVRFLVLRFLVLRFLLLFFPRLIAASITGTSAGVALVRRSSICVRRARTFTVATDAKIALIPRRKPVRTQYWKDGTPAIRASLVSQNSQKEGQRTTQSFTSCHQTFLSRSPQVAVAAVAMAKVEGAQTCVPSWHRVKACRYYRAGLHIRGNLYGAKQTIGGP